MNEMRKITQLDLTKLFGTLTFIQAILPARLQFRYLEQKQISTLKKSSSYMAKVTLNTLAKEELAYWIYNLELSNGPALPDTSANRCIQERVERSVPKDENRESVIKEETRMSYQFYGTSSHKAGIIDLQQNDEVQVSAYSSRQFNGPELPFENGGNKESVTPNIFKRDMGVPFQTSGDDYCRVPRRSTESSGRLGIKKLERFLGVKIISTNFQKSLSQGRTTRDRSICFSVVESIPSILLVETRSK